MEELELTKDLYINIMGWMSPKYALGTIINRAAFLKKMFKKYQVLNQETLRKIMKGIKYQHQRACLVMINDYCYENNIPFNLIIPSIKKQANKLPYIFSSEEISLMIKSVPYPYNLAIRCIFNMGAGLRVSEIIKFKWDHIRWVDWLSNKDNYGIAVIKAGKGSKDRIVNIPKRLMQDLYDYAIKQKKYNEFRVPTGGMVFDFGLTQKGDAYQKKFMKIMEGNDIKAKDYYVRSRYNWFRYNIIQKHCEKALNKHIKVHSLRHSRATYLYEVEKVPVEKIQILLGHSSLNTTMLYTKINPIGVFDLLKNTKEV